MGSEFRHTSVLLQKAIEYLEVRQDAWYVDATAGGGGHTQEIRSRGGNVLAIDQDEDAVRHLEKRFEGDKGVALHKGNFSLIKDACHTHNVRPEGVLFDLGVSSYQIDDSERGFSFQRDEVLDMRMNKDGDISAQEIVNTYSYEDLYNIFTKYGEEPYAEQIAGAILRARRVKKIESTSELVEIIKKVSDEKRIHPATRVFQALRIESNQELDALREGLRDAVGIVGRGGRVVVISFHSLEDRIVKQFMETESEKGIIRTITKKPILADWKEVKKNVRSRSAKMRVMEKI